MNMPSTNTKAEFVLRVGMALVMLWFGFQQLLHPGAWVGFLPHWIGLISPNLNNFVYINGMFEIVLGAFLMLGFWTPYIAALLSLHLLGITISVGYGPTGVRDFGLTVALAALSISGFASKGYSVRS